LKTVQCGNYEELKILLGVRTVDCNYRSLSTGQTALMHCKSARIAQLLLQNGAGKLFFFNFETHQINFDQIVSFSEIKKL
jgi:hypothetical protein